MNYQKSSSTHISHERGYTLVELIVVIAILVVLSTVGFVGYSQYTASSRDGARVSDLRAIYQGIGVSISQKGIAPVPDSPISIYASTGVLLSLQGSVGETVRQAIGLESGGRDPMDGVGYTYLRNKDKKSVQLMGYFESDGWGARMAMNNTIGDGEEFALDDSTLWNATVGTTAYAATDYTDRYPAAFGKKLGVFTDCTNKSPLNEVTAYTASGVNLALPSIATGSGICIIGNSSAGISENLSATGVLARVLSPASLVVASGSGIPSGPKGTSASDSAASCKALQTNGVSTDGLYWIKPTADPAFQAYCDMTTDGGGWTKMMHANMPDVFSSGWANVGSPTGLGVYSILGQRTGFIQNGKYEFRLQIGRSGDTNTPASKSNYTIWKQPHDAFTQRTDGAGYEFIAGEQSPGLGGFNGLYGGYNIWAVTAEADTADNANNSNMFIVPLAVYPGLGGKYLDAYGSPYLHNWQIIWLR